MGDGFLKFYFILTKRVLFSFCCLIFVAVCIFSKYSDVVAQTNKNGDTHKKRYDFLSNLNCEIFDEEAKEKEIVIPLQFGNVYNAYNALQGKAGYDLSLYKGEKCTLYSYRIKKFKMFKDDDFANANLIVYNGRIIGGDFSSAKINGKMYPLKKYEKTKT